jgi:enediyne biosynthesis protein E4
MNNLRHNSKGEASHHQFSLPILATLLVTISLWTGCGQDEEIENKPIPRSQASQTPKPTINNDRQKAATAPSAQMKINPISHAWQTRAKEQGSALEAAKTVHAFQFNDILESSGILFEHQAVDDAGKYYKPVHYDHGNGVAAADVDSDGLLDLYFTNQIGPNGLWRNEGNGTFSDLAANGLAMEDRVSVGAAFADIDNDGDQDLFVTTVKMGNVLFENLGDGRFQEITGTAGVGYIGHSSGVVFLDYDNDGLLDLYVTNVGVYTGDKKGAGGYYIGYQNGFSGHQYPERSESGILYHNEGGNKFKDVTEVMGLESDGWNGDATVCDVNQDGWQDLYVTNMQGDDTYFENHAGQAFEDKTSAYFPQTSWGAMGVKFFDFNLDGKMDLYVTDMHSDMNKEQTVGSKQDASESFERSKSEVWCTIEYTDAYLKDPSNNIFGNAFYVQREDNKFDEVSDTIGAETFWPWGVSAGDINADGFEDVFVTAGMGFGFRYGINSVLLNQSGERFQSAEFPLSIEPRAETFKVAFTLDCSGSDKDHPYCQGRSGIVPFTEPKSSRSSMLV